MKDILIIANFCDGPGENTNNRFNYLANILAAKCNVELVTSKFSHTNKRMREDIKSDKNYRYKLTMIEEPGYIKNVSIKRFYSHYILSKNIYEYIKKRKKPDKIYCAIPSLDVARAVAKYAKENKIQLVLDIQDLWPEAFQMLINIPVLSDVCFYPLKFMADRIYKSADSIIAVSNTYLERGLKVNKTSKYNEVVYLGTDLEKFDEYVSNYRVNKCENEKWIIYTGTLGHSYNLKIIIDALKQLKNRGITNLRFIVLGDGPLASVFRDYAKDAQILCDFKGKMSYEYVAAYLNASDIAVNPIKDGSAGSIINKVGDYAAAGIAVINTQQCVEYRNIIDKYKCGINCNNKDVDFLAKQIELLYKDNDMCIELGRNNRKLAAELFDRNKTYRKIEKILLDEV